MFDKIQNRNQYEILIVDDSKESLKLLNSILEECGYRPRSASSSHFALKTVAVRLPDLILLDVQMPEMDGYEVCRRLKSNAYSRNIPVIFISADGDTARKVEGFKAGGVDYIAKPFGREEVLARVEIHLRLHELTERLEQQVDQRTKQLKLEIDERKQAESELKESQKRFRRMIEKSPLPMAITDQNLKFVLLSDKFSDLFGYTLQDAVRAEEWWKNAFPEKGYREQVQRAWMAAIQKPKGANTDIEKQEWEVTIKDRTKRTCEFHMIPLGNVGLIVMNDITEKKHLEKRLVESESRFGAIFDHANDGILVAEAATKRLIMANNTICKMLGYTREEILNMSVRDIHPRNDLPKVLETFDKQLNKKIEIAGNLPVLRKDGTIFFAEINPTPVTLGTQNCLIGIFRDITERKFAEEALQAEKEKAQRYLDIAGVIFVALNTDGNVTLINKKGCEVLGYEYEEIIGMNWFENFIPVWLQEELMPVSKKLLNGDIESAEYHENPVLTKSGEERLIAWHNTVLRDEGGNISGHLSSGEDISDKRHLETQLHQAQKMKSIGTLAGGIAHDFNNILAPIVGYTEMALEEIDENSFIYEDLQEIYKAANRATDLVKQILTFARRSDEKLQPIRVKPVVKDALKFLRSSIPASVDIKENITSDSIVTANQTQLHQVLMNLCTNSQHAIGEKEGVIGIVVEDVDIIDRAEVNYRSLTPGQYVKISVSDNGIGIPEEALGSIFEPYYTTKKQGEGTGLGLAIVHGIVSKSGGAISVESECGRGSTFSIFLPIAAIDEKYEPYESTKISTGQGKILFVDDEETIAEMNRKILESLGYDVTACTSSLEALQLFEHRPEYFDLVITDMTMPHMTGDRLATKIKEINSNTLVILCTGHSKKLSDKPESSYDFDAILYKPIAKARLAQTVSDLISAT